MILTTIDKMFGLGAGDGHWMDAGCKGSCIFYQQYTHMYICTHIYTRTHRHARIHIHTCTHIHIDTHTQIHIYTYTHRHTYTHHIISK